MAVRILIATIMQFYNLAGSRMIVPSRKRMVPLQTVSDSLKGKCRIAGVL